MYKIFLCSQNVVAFPSCSQNAESRGRINSVVSRLYVAYPCDVIMFADICDARCCRSTWPTIVMRSTRLKRGSDRSLRLSKLIEDAHIPYRFFVARRVSQNAPLFWRVPFFLPMDFRATTQGHDSTRFEGDTPFSARFRSFTQRRMRWPSRNKNGN